MEHYMDVTERRTDVSSIHTGNFFFYKIQSLWSNSFEWTICLSNRGQFGTNSQQQSPNLSASMLENAGLWGALSGNPDTLGNIQNFLKTNGF